MKSNIPSTNLQEGLGKLELPVPAGGTLVTITFKGQRPSGVIKTEWTIDNQSTNSELDEIIQGVAEWLPKGMGLVLKAEIMDLITSHTKSAVEAARLDEITQMLAVGLLYAGKLKPFSNGATDKEMVEAYRNLGVAYEKHLTKRAADLTGPPMPDIKADKEAQ